VGPRAGLDTEVRGNIFYPCLGSNFSRPEVQSVARHYTDLRYPGSHRLYIKADNLKKMHIPPGFYMCVKISLTY
jgi:hypothetical protein